ncbi:RsiV family protein [Chitinophaga pollutisoli]|uniref:RsiV family protein n=1 Tax=Chitinophaga pollutisoli TaxID=3133966 RepID=UPI00385789BC
MPNDNFYLTNKGAVFSFVPYEIAAYAAGQITLFVPWNEIRSVVQPAYLPTKP